MKILLDTHVLLWFFFEEHLLSETVKSEVLKEENEVFYSAVSVWETALKHKAHPDKLHISGREFATLCNDSGFVMLPLTERHIYALETIRKEENTPPHKDPFDQVLIAQAKAEGMTLFSHDKKLSYYNEPCVSLF